MALSLTTHEINDKVPTSQLSRCAAVFMIPLGLVVVGMALSFLHALVLAYCSAIAWRIKKTTKRASQIANQGQNNITNDTYDDDKDDDNYATSEPISLRDTLAFQYFLQLLKFSFIAGIGTVFFLYFSDEFDEQVDAAAAYDDGTSSFTIVDALYFSIVVSTTVGYGHRLVVHTDEAKIFLIFFAFVSTSILGAIINDISDLYMIMVCKIAVEKEVEASTIYVHKADVFDRGEVSEPEYLLFKIMQMSAAPASLIKRLSRRFHELDRSRSGVLAVGTDVPSANQVQEMEAMLHGIPRAEVKKKLPDLWRKVCAGELTLREARGSAIAAEPRTTADLVKRGRLAE